MSRVQLKSIKHSPSLSEETYAFTANLYFDGVKVGVVSNRGCGGCNDVHLTDRTLYQEIEDYAKSLPPVKFNSSELEMDLDLLISELVGDFIEKKAKAQEEKRLANWVKKESAKNKEKGLSTVKIKTNNSLVCIGVRPGMSGDQVVANYKLKNPQVIIRQWEVLN